MSRSLVRLSVIVLLAAGCGGASSKAEVPAPRTAASAPATSASADPLGPKPTLAAPAPFTPTAPEVFSATNGITVWLARSSTLPLVSATFVVPHGSAADPTAAPGLASLTADMLDEGAGKRGAIELSSAVNDLGASLMTGASVDGSYVSLSVLKKNFGDAFALMSDVIARPRFTTEDFRRVHTLWRNDLEQRGDDPSRVSSVITRAAVFGADTPYGHPPDGLLAKVDSVTAPLVRSFYASSWRPEHAVLVVTGDVSREDVTRALDSGLKGWKPAGKAPPPVPVSPAPSAPRLIIVDRPDAPQAVIAVARPGVKASDPSAPLLDLLNVGLGGSFSSRLNQNLREEHGYTYGARSAFVMSRDAGSFVARAAVSTPVTGPALKEMLRELTELAAGGLRPGELEKAKAQGRADLVQSYETISGLGQHLASLAMVGLLPSYDEAAAKARESATELDLNNLAPAVTPKDATIIVVGPKDLVLPQLAPLNLGEPVYWDVEGRPVPTAKAK